MAWAKSVGTLSGRTQSLSGLCRGPCFPTKRIWSAPGLTKVCRDSVGAYPEFIGTLSGPCFPDQTHLEWSWPEQSLSGLCRGVPRVYRDSVGGYVLSIKRTWSAHGLGKVCRDSVGAYPEFIGTLSGAMFPRPNAPGVLLAWARSVGTLSGRTQEFIGTGGEHVFRPNALGVLTKVCRGFVGTYPEFIGTLSGPFFPDQTYL
jgi:hypothetical protein